MSAWNLTRLQRALRERAEAVDVLVHAALSPATPAGYRQWLCDLYGFIEPFERRFAFTHQLDIWFIEQRIKSGRLSADLLALGLTRDEFARLSHAPAIPEFTHPLDALGWLLVVERLTLQLAGIRRRLQPALGRELATAGSFVAVYDGATDAMWSGLGRMVDRWVASEADLQQVQTAAFAGLDALESWLDANGVVVEASHMWSA